jgi:MFS family permease
VAWLRLFATVLVAAIGGVGMWSVVVALPVMQAEFGGSRADASLAFTLSMLGVAAGGLAMGWLLDRVRILPPLSLGAIMLALGYVGAGHARNLATFALAHTIIGFGSSVAFGPLMIDISHWFVRRRGLAVALSSAGNYVAGRSGRRLRSILWA